MRANVVNFKIFFCDLSFSSAAWKESVSCIHYERLDFVYTDLSDLNICSSVSLKYLLHSTKKSNLLCIVIIRSCLAITHQLNVRIWLVEGEVIYFPMHIIFILDEQPESENKLLTNIIISRAALLAKLSQQLQ